MKRLPLIFLLLFLSVFLSAQDSPASAGIDPKQMDEMNKFANVQKDPASLSSPGAELRLEEVERHKTPDGTMVGYRLKANNLPTDRKYQLGMLRVNRQVQQEDTLKTISSSGEIMDGPDDPHTLILMAAKGESYVVILSTEDAKYKAVTSVVPFPIQQLDKSCSIDAVLLAADAEGVLLRGRGFQPDISAKVDIDSEGEKHSGNVQIDKFGNMSFVLMPYKKGKKKGIAHIAVTTPSCNPKLDVGWGKGQYQVE